MTIWHFISYLISSGIGGIIVNIYNTVTENNDVKKMRAINSSFSINRISEELRLIAFSLSVTTSADNLMQKRYIVQQHLCYLNAWAEYIDEHLVDLDTVYDCSKNSLYIISNVLKLLQKTNMNKTCRLQINHYQQSYRIVSMRGRHHETQ